MKTRYYIQLQNGTWKETTFTVYLTWKSDKRYSSFNILQELNNTKG